MNEICEQCGKSAELWHDEPTGQALCDGCTSRSGILHEFFASLAGCQSSVREIECLRTALDRAVALVDAVDLQQLTEELEVITTPERTAQH